jgi:large subunit ribosomal protein L29
MEPREIRSWTTEDLERRLADAYQERFALRRELALGRLEDHNRITAVKRDIARMRTILRERELSAEFVGGGEEEP